MIYPNTPIPNFPIERKTKTYKHRSQFMGGYTQQRKKTDKKTKIFSLTYNDLTLVQAEALESFLLDDSSFTFQDPEKEGVSYTCIYPEEEVIYSADEPNSYNMTITIQEV